MTDAVAGEPGGEGCVQHLDRERPPDIGVARLRSNFLVAIEPLFGELQRLTAEKRLR